MWEQIGTAPKDGSAIIIKAVSGTDRGHVLFEGEASWRSENKEALFDPLTGERFAEATTITGWMRLDIPYRVPGIPIMWKNRYPTGERDGALTKDKKVFWLKRLFNL